ncbi:archaemetzincin-2-like isoform X1 [Brachionus plicatilis]|uniref:Archaemetzincin-2-like isoform X1 n=1 Tax=Brachionus plicatilis TaxID=10195 RepID=A0A3M7RNK1_BRAPC|nr:archaemetzincin-2-like isoform X1 [Brachionus plicatilis]
MEVEIQTEEKKNTMIVKAKYDQVCYELKSRYDNKSKHFQIRANSIHEFLTKIAPKGAKSLIGFTEYDIFIDDSDLFVAGLCNGLLRVGVFSIFRYMPRLKFCEEKWYEYTIPQNFDHKTWLKRSCKLMIHETCHLLGFAHCVYKDCCMNGSGHLKEDFRQSMFLCPIDLKKLWLILNFDMKKRYELLKQFFDERKCSKESRWLGKVVKTLE